MEFSKKQVSTILEALRASPRGLNVSEASRVTGLNRSTVAKYLEMLYVSGHADMKTFGTSKLYYISQRMPISAFLNFSSDLIIVLDKDSRVLNANDSFFEFTGTQREDVVHKYFDNFAFPLKFNPSIMPYIARAIDGHEDAIESYYPKKDSGHYFNIKLIPLLFDDGGKGATLILEDITEKKLAEKALLNANFELEKKVKERTKELEKANEALRKSEAYLLEAGQIAHLGYWSYDTRTKETYASDVTIRLFGVSQGTRWNQELFRSMIHPDDIPKIDKANKEAMSRDTPIDYEYRIIRSDGSERFIHSVRGVRRNDAGETIELFGTIQDITPQKRLEIALKESEERLHMAIEGADMGMWDTDRLTGESIWSERTFRMLGYEPVPGGKSTRAMWTSLIHPEDAPQVERVIETAIRERSTYTLEHRIIRADNGQVVWLQLFNRFIFNEEGQAVRSLGVMLDITERKRAEEALRNSELKFKTLFEGSSTAIFIIDLGTRVITDCNEYAAGLVGRNKEELIGMHHSMLHPPESAKPCRNNTRIHSKDGRAVNYETELVHKDGHRIPILINSTIMEVDGKKLMIGSYLDITERKRAEEAMRKSEENFRAAFEQAAVGATHATNDGRFLRVNQKFCDITGYAREELVEMAARDITYQPDIPEEVRLIQRMLAGELSTFSREKRYVRKDGAIVWVNLTVTPIFHNGTLAYLMGVTEDITERKRAEAALKDSEEKFRALADFSMIGILLIQGEDTIYANQALADMFGYTVDECLKIKYWDTATPEMKEFIKQRGLLRQRGEPGPSRNELKMVKKNGEYIWLDCTAAMLQYREKPAMMLTAMDITERKLVESELRMSEVRYRSLFEKKHDLVWETDENNLCIYMSPRAKDIVGYGQEEIIGKTPFDYMPPEEVMRVMGQIKPLLDEHKPFDIMNYYMIKKDGGRAYFNTHAMPIFDEGGRLKGYRGVCRYIGDGTNGRQE